MKVRGFKIVEDWARKFPDGEIKLPNRKTEFSAGYDFYTNNSAVILPGQAANFFFDVKAYMQDDEFLLINVRSSIGFKKHLCLVNTQGWIDADFYSNPENDGNISACLFNYGTKPVIVEKGERIVQGCFMSYRVKDNDSLDRKIRRKGGIGSTGKL